MNAGTCWEQEYNRPMASVLKNLQKATFTFTFTTTTTTTTTNNNNNNNNNNINTGPSRTNKKLQEIYFEAAKH